MYREVLIMDNDKIHSMILKRMLIEYGLCERVRESNVPGDWSYQIRNYPIDAVFYSLQPDPAYMLQLREIQEVLDEKQEDIALFVMYVLDHEIKNIEKAGLRSLKGCLLRPLRRESLTAVLQ
jgi:AmiR/NasT family two-component response regulator